MVKVNKKLNSRLLNIQLYDEMPVFKFKNKQKQNYASKK